MCCQPPHEAHVSWTPLQSSIVQTFQNESTYTGILTLHTNAPKIMSAIKWDIISMVTFCIKSYMTGTTGETETVYFSGIPECTLGF